VRRQLDLAPRPLRALREQDPRERDEVAALAVEQEKLEAWILEEVDRGVPLPGLYPPNAEAKARYEASRRG